MLALNYILVRLEPCLNGFFEHFLNDSISHNFYSKHNLTT